VTPHSRCCSIGSGAAGGGVRGDLLVLLAGDHAFKREFVEAAGLGLRVFFLGDVAGEIGLGLGELGAVAGEGGLSLAKGRLEGALVYGEQELALADEVTLVEVHGGEFAADEALYTDGRDGLDVTDRTDLNGHVLLNSLRDGNGGFRAAGRRRSGTRTATQEYGSGCHHPPPSPAIPPMRHLCAPLYAGKRVERVCLETNRRSP
jgi:hypothetical protein